MAGLIGWWGALGMFGIVLIMAILIRGWCFLPAIWTG